MKQKDRWLRLMPIIAMALIILLFGSALRKISLQDILSYVPGNLFLAALALWGLYALKSISVVFPIVVLYLSAGALFDTGWGILVSLVGLLICITIPFFIGRFSGSDAVGRLVAKHPKAAKISEYSNENSVFFSYLLRVVNLLPGDLVSMTLGACGMPYLPYATGSLLGLVPVMIPTVVIGGNLDNPFSARFLIPFAVIVAISLASSLFYNRWQRRKKQRRTQSP